MSCKVKVNRHGYLALRLYWNGIESWEGMGLKDTPRNRKRAEAIAVLISQEMEEGTFDYLKRFPGGNRADDFQPEEKSNEIQEQTVGQFYQEWIQKKKPPLVRRSLERDYRLCFDRYILPQFKDVQLSEVSFNLLENFRFHLVEERGLSVKTARNIIDGCFRAMWRDARKRGIPGAKEGFESFVKLEWPRLIIQPSDPFTGKERDKVLAYFKTKTAYADYAFLFTLFWTGMRPSEVTALRWGDIDLNFGKISVTKSRHMKAEAPTKTRASVRTVKLLPEVIDVLKQLYPLRVTEQDYIFRDEHGNPFDAQGWMWKHWNRALRACGVRHRKFYSTRHTYISTALTAGVKSKWLSEQTGTSMRMIEERYGRYIQDDGDAPLRALFGAKTETFVETFSEETRKGLKKLVVPTGIEPVLPT